MCLAYERLQKLLTPFLNEPITHFVEEKQNSKYDGSLFQISQYTFRHRLAKKTPTKKGYFVVFWEKGSKNENKPFDFDQSPDFLLVTIIDEEKTGLFLFSKSVLSCQNILRTSQTKGKMAMRVYPSWEKNLNKTAEKTQKWQRDYFIDLSHDRIDRSTFAALLKN